MQPHSPTPPETQPAMDSIAVYASVIDAEPDMSAGTVGVMAVHRPPLWRPEIGPVFVSATATDEPSRGQLASLQPGDLIRLEGAGRLVQPGPGMDRVFVMTNPAVELVERQLAY